MKNSINIKIGGHAGEGIKVSGLILTRSLTRLGYSTFSYSEYPSLIRGGHNTYQIQVGLHKVQACLRKLDILIALNQETIKLHQDELKKTSLVIYDPGEFKLPLGELKGKYLAIPLLKITNKAGGKPIMANMASLASVLTLLGIELNTFKDIIRKEFSKKGEDLVKANIEVGEAGKNYVLKNYFQEKLVLEKPKTNLKRMVLTGNEAIALGALAGGLQFYSAYPMTPATSILHYLASIENQTNIVVKQTEDEISAINMALGASFAGVLSMTATSGGGLCLMAEGISMAGVAEIPLVIVNSMRPGPALGMPTWTSQGDLQFVLHIGHDEFPRIIFTPGDAKEAFELTKLSFELAEKYQLPVFILVDKYLSESDFSTQLFKKDHPAKRFSMADNLGPKDEFYKRYKLTENGVSKRSIPGQKGGIHCCNSYEHDENGLGTEEGEMRIKMMDKRMKKMKLLEKEIKGVSLFGPKKAKLSLISWGSNKGVILEALKELKNVNFLHLSCVWPFPKKEVEEFIKTSEKCYSIEGNATGQLTSLIKQETGLTLQSVLKYDGRPFWVEEIIKKFTN
ncbi:2-oxoacid:acceptor oxidoreductase subunit alpha [Candidatus Beckwithbacteria bacterium CG10_big_fil_rev_8_21_14_0_10_34_10]|uniref:2-oxoacid:acceptor oxidoreductase subunit alpha n=1 Tax=Candidatus Beckwithbacteria bacterium CG10_big_fil_rev_8_21_14_0_10_34_10 TaxID=1974495 RepID=A0A2H0WAF3_9BACT|nr:MAG: 2-oxoacid:acceptor oxidoreductase subunit alpha [Candidatus Beckwithbacteria bacterium CG10_big_fil_rev_8_21_14_0_10_34_10]